MCDISKVMHLRVVGEDIHKCLVLVHVLTTRRRGTLTLNSTMTEGGSGRENEVTTGKKGSITQGKEIYFLEADSNFRLVASESMAHRN